MQPDYSRQVSLKEIGRAGQDALARSRVLIVGVGGLGSPVAQYLAGAGVGRLGLVDVDILAASNLHRQPLYALGDVGRPKVELARAAIHRINPDVGVDTHAVRLAPDNALDLVRTYDLIVDCSDNFATKFLVNDAAVLAQRPAVFASVYQFEGHLQVYKPVADHACLRCVWPEATPDGLVGNCAEAGVLGPVPGAFGSLQALLALKILTGMPGQLGGELWLLDFTNLSSVKLKAPRRPACAAPHCALIRDIAQDRDIEIDYTRISALPAPVEFIDIRSHEEFAERPSRARHIAMAELLKHPEVLSSTAGYVLVCASGKRSLAAARELRKRGLAVRSLTGGLHTMENS